jgi:PKHD-type hydroxylase
MRLKQSFSIQDSYFPAEFCKQVIELAESGELMEGAVRHDPEKKSRSSEVAWLKNTPENRWIYDPVQALLNTVNNGLWGWNITEVESLQYTRYGENQFYGWHADARPEPYPEGKRWGGLVRKLSITICLSNESDYDGGDFAIELTGPVPTSPERRIQTIDTVRHEGTAVIFPSHLHHEVRAVTRGVRRSLVGWFLGPPFV